MNESLLWSQDPVISTESLVESLLPWCTGPYADLNSDDTVDISFSCGSDIHMLEDPCAMTDAYPS